MDDRSLAEALLLVLILVNDQRQPRRLDGCFPEAHKY